MEGCVSEGADEGIWGKHRQRCYQRNVLRKGWHEGVSASRWEEPHVWRWSFRGSGLGWHLLAWWSPTLATLKLRGDNVQIVIINLVKKNLNPVMWLLEIKSSELLLLNKEGNFLGNIWKINYYYTDTYIESILVCSIIDCSFTHF